VYSFEEILGTHVQEFSHFSKFGDLSKKIEKELYKNKFWEGEIIFRNKVNKVYYFETKIFLIENDDENKFLMLQSDISEKFVLERNLINKNNQYNDLLRHVFSLEKFDFAKLKEDLAKLELLNEENKPLLEDINELANKIKDIRNSRFININTDTIKMTYCDFLKIVRSELENIKSRVKEKNITLKSSYNILFSNIYLDENLSRAMLSNLFDNSLKFAPNDSVIDVKVIQRNGFLNLQIIDERQIISPEHREKILSEYFERYDNAGLIFARDIAERHNGTLEIESPAKEINKGVKFVLKLPIERREYNR